METCRLWSIGIAFALVRLSTATGGILELPIATSETGLLNFWPRLNASCEFKPLEDNLCCLDSTFHDGSSAQYVLRDILESVPEPKYEVYRIPQWEYKFKSSQGFEVATRYRCDIPLGASETELSRFSGCQKCLQSIVEEVVRGMPENGRCANTWAMRFGLVYEPETPWEEDTTWCHLDYSFSVLPSSYSSSSLPIVHGFGEFIHGIIRRLHPVVNWASSFLLNIVM